MGSLFGSILFVGLVAQLINTLNSKRLEQGRPKLVQPMTLPKGSIIVIQLILGLGVGSIASLSTIVDTISVPVFLGLLVCLSIQISLGFFWLYRAEKWSLGDSLMGAIPGALSALLSLSGRYHTPSPKVIFAHSVRLVLLVCLAAVISLNVVPQGVATEPQLATELPVDWAWLCLVTVVALLCGWAADKLNIPAPFLVCSLTVAIGFGSMFDHAQLVVPGFLLEVSTAILGAVIGIKLTAVKIAEAWRYARAGLIVTSLSVSVTILTAFVASYLLGIDWPVLILAWVPGNVEAMTTIALTFAMSPAFVMINHVIRLFILNLAPLAIGFILPAKGVSQNHEA